MRLVGCIRVSRVSGRTGVSFISTDVQRDQITAYAKAHGHKVVEWREDLDRPGSNLDRPGLNAALELVKTGGADGIIAAKLDRLTRSIVDLGNLLALAREGGWNLIAVDHGLDLNTPNGKLVAHLLGAVAEWELDRRRTDWDEARARAVARGVHVASRTPTGYRKQDDGVLEPDPSTAPAIRELFRRRAHGDGWTVLARYLAGEGVVTPYGNETWTTGAVRTLIVNRVYLGEARSGAHINPGAHEPLVTEAEWHAAQSTRSNPHATSDRVTLLSGLVRCGSCRYIARAVGMTDRGGKRLSMYSCRGRHAAGHCPQPASILARVLDPIVEHEILAWLASESPTAQAHQATAGADAALAELAAAENDLLAYTASDTLAIAGTRAFEHGLTVRRTRVDDAQAELRQHQARHIDLNGLTPSDLLDAWPELALLERREIIAAAIDCVVIWPRSHSGSLPADRVRIIPAGDQPDDLPTRGRRVPLAPWPNSPLDLGMTPLQNPDESPLNRL